MKNNKKSPKVELKLGHLIPVFGMSKSVSRGIDELDNIMEISINKA